MRIPILDDWTNFSQLANDGARFIPQFLMSSVMLIFVSSQKPYINVSFPLCIFFLYLLFIYMNQICPSSVSSPWYINTQLDFWDRCVHMSICVFMKIHKECIDLYFTASERHGYYWLMWSQNKKIDTLQRVGAFNTGKALMDHAKYTIYHHIYRTQILSRCKHINALSWLAPTARA